MNQPSAPQYPDPAQTAAAQTASNKETAVAQTGLNSTNQVTPYGNLSYSQIGKWDDGTPRFQATTTLAPEQQGLLDQQTQLSGKLNSLGLSQADKINGLLGTNVDLSAGNIDKYTSDHYSDDFNKQWDQNLSSLDSTLANKGIKIGSTAYTRALGDFNSSRGSAFDNLLGDMSGNARSAILAERNQPINEITALMGGGQVQTPQFGSTPQSGIEGTDVAGLTNGAYNAAYGNYQNQVSQNNATMGGLFNLGSSLLGGWALSDKRAKTDIKKVGELPNELGVYSFKYKPGMGGGLTQLGVMAQEVEKKDPGAVATGSDGLKRVNYPRVLAGA